MLQNELLVAKFRFDAAENELSEVELLTGFGDFDKVVMNEVSAKKNKEVSAKEERWLVRTIRFCR